MFKNIGATWILNFLQIGVVMKLAPYVVHSLGREQNGVWVTIVSLTGFLGLLILGVPMASVRYVAEHVAKKDLARTNAAISTCLGICLTLGAVALVTAACLYPFLNATFLHGPQDAALSPDVLEGAKIAFAVVSFQVAMSFAMRLPYGIFDAHHDFVVRNAIMAGELALRLALTLGLLAWKATLPTLAFVQVGCMLFEFATAVFVVHRRYPGVRFGLRGFDRKLVRGILGFSLFAMLLNLGAQLAFRSDALVIKSHLDATQVTYFDIGNKFFDPMTNLLIAVGAVMMPMATRLQATGETEELRHLFLKWSKISVSIVLAIAIYLIVLGPEFLGWWIGPEYEGPSGRVLQILMGAFLVYLPVRGVALPVLLGLGKPAAPALTVFAMGLVNVGLSLALVKPYGILGVAIGTALPDVVCAIVLATLACRELGVGVRSYLVYVAGRPLIGALAPLGLLLFLKYEVGIAGFVPLFLSGLALLLAFASAWIAFVYRGDPYLDLRAEIRRFLPGSAGGKPS